MAALRTILDWFLAAFFIERLQNNVITTHNYNICYNSCSNSISLIYVYKCTNTNNKQPNEI